MQSNIRFRVRTILSESLEKDFNEITDKKLLVGDLGGGSVEITDIKLKIHQEFGVPMEILDRKCLLGDIPVKDVEQIVNSFLKNQ